MAANDTFLFEYYGKVYRVSTDAYDLDKVVLPDGTLLHILNWSETIPPQPKEIEQIPHILPKDDPQTIAVQLGAVVAEEITVTQ